MKLIFVFVFAIVFCGIVSALPNPASVYCLEMNYTLDGEDCVFFNGTRCEQWAFFNGECGLEYVKNLSCKVAGERLSSATECCEGLAGIEEYVSDENGECSLIIGNYAVCSDCGDGFCDEWENFCNCPDDCEFCVDNCGDGVCDEVEIIGGSCLESVESCPEDCKGGKFKFSFYSIVLFVGAVVFIFLAVKFAKMILWVLAGLVVLLAFYLIFVW